MRLVTRADLDGLTCAVLLSQCEKIDSITLAQAQDVMDRRLAIGNDDILANLPYHPACGLWFDNHLLTDSRSVPPAGFKGRYGQAPSAARVVYDHYSPRHPELARHEGLLAETDRLDSAQLTMADVVSPDGYVLLGFTLDARSGLGGLDEYFGRLLPAVRDLAVEAVLALPEVRERVSRLREQDRAFRQLALERSRLHGTVVVSDFRDAGALPAGNRFLVFTLFPQATVAVRVQAGPEPGTVSISAGRSLFNRGSRANLGVLLSLHGGGGHPGAAACVVPAHQADGHLGEIVASLRRNA
jgi:hypothetical protein